MGELFFETHYFYSPKKIYNLRQSVIIKNEKQ